MKRLSCALIALLLASANASAGGGGAGFAAGFAGGLSNAEMQQLCIAALRNQIAGGPPAPASCNYSAPAPAYVAPPTTVYVAPRHCVTRPNIPGSLGTVYETTCY